MGQILVRQLDDATIAQLKIAARARRTSAEAIARQAITEAARLTVKEKLDVVQQLQAWGEAAKVPGVTQSLGIDLIREDRDR
jgi:antitoxin FitA